MEYDSDFYGDYIDHLRGRLTAMGVKFDPSTDPMRIEFDYWTAVRRSVPLKPRKVLRAKDFEAPPALQTALATLERKFVKGEDVNPHLSNTRLKAKRKHFNDGLFNDWRIHHFHFDPIKRINECLFAVVDDDAVYFLDIMVHGRYGEIDLLERIKASGWDHLLGPKMTIPPTMTPPTGNEIMVARDSGITTISQLADGSIYFPAGGGISTAKVGSASVSIADRARDRLTAMEDWFHTEGIARIERQAVDFGGKPTFKLVGDADGNFEVADAGGKVRMPMGSINPILVRTLPRARPHAKKWVSSSTKRRRK